MGEIKWHSHVPVYLWTLTLLFSDVVVVSDLSKNFDGFGEKKARIGGFAYFYSPPSASEWFASSTSGVWNGQDWSVLGQEKKKPFRNRGMFKIGIGFSLSTRPESRRSSPLDLSVLKTIYFSSSQNMSLLLLPEKKICYLLPLDKELPTPRELLRDLEEAEVRTLLRTLFWFKIQGLPSITLL